LTPDSSAIARADKKHKIKNMIFFMIVKIAASENQIQEK
tara:strand:- start:154 stop:270 length:117 start_codon:yes stop_codon:yes gene_type:complete